MNCLFERIARENAEQDRYAALERGLHDAQTDRAVDVAVVRGLAANHRA